MFQTEIKEHLIKDLIPFWQGLEDHENGGFYGYLDYDLKLDKKAVKGCILNSRILWFFSNAYLLLKEESLLESARHAFEFLKNHCVDSTYGGVFILIIRHFLFMLCLLIMMRQKTRKR